jgi:hypothetical protein
LLENVAKRIENKLAQLFLHSRVNSRAQMRQESFRLIHMNLENGLY